jgi:hypothetical protein
MINRGDGTNEHCMNRKNDDLPKIMKLRTDFKEVLQIIRITYPDQKIWADEIDTDIETLFTNYLDAPTADSRDAFGRYWLCTEPAIQKIMGLKRS